MKTIVLSQQERRKPFRQGFETISDIIRGLESRINFDHFDADLSSALDATLLLRQEMNEGRGQ